MFAKILVCIIVLVGLLLGQSNVYVPGEVVVRVKRGIVALPLGVQKAGLEVIQDMGIRIFLLNHNFIELERAIPDFSPSETLTTLENGEVVKVPDFSLIFIFRFPIESDIISM
ncbi:MAG: hypothetical protein N3A65_09520 [candidate division WOR-3 bacterium]|nr:hypothetical protein [candidate division WOR-3 bacterium]